MPSAARCGAPPAARKPPLQTGTGIGGWFAGLRPAAAHRTLRPRPRPLQRGPAHRRVAPPTSPPRRRGQPGSVARQAGGQQRSAPLGSVLRHAAGPPLLPALPPPPAAAAPSLGAGRRRYGAGGLGGSGEKLFFGEGEKDVPLAVLAKVRCGLAALSTATSWSRVSVRVSCGALGWGAPDPRSCTPRREWGGRGFLRSYQAILFYSVCCSVVLFHFILFFPPHPQKPNRSHPCP